MIMVKKLRMCYPVRLGSEHKGGHFDSAGSHRQEIEHRENLKKEKKMLEDEKH